MKFAVVVMGVSGCGKSTVGSALAHALGVPFFDADDFHPRANKDKMRAGVALTDEDRAPWLATLNETLRESCAQASRSDQTTAGCVLACSALKARYRTALRAGVPVKFVHLFGTPAEISARLATRAHEYMPATLLSSQFAALERPTDAIEVSVNLPVPEQVSFALKRILSHNL